MGDDYIGKKVTLTNLTLEVKDKRLLHIKSIGDSPVLRSDLTEYLDAVKNEFGGQLFANIVEFGSFTNITSDARSFAATPESNKYTVADAFVLKSLSQRILGNFYLKIDKPVVPTRLFQDYAAAEKWMYQSILPNLKLEDH